MCSLVTRPCCSVTSRMTNLSEGHARFRLWHRACISTGRGQKGEMLPGACSRAGMCLHHWTRGLHRDLRGWQSPGAHGPGEGEQRPVTVHAAGGASPVPGSAHPSPGKAFAEFLGPPQVLSPLNPAEQMALSHLQRHLASRRTRPVLHHGCGSKTAGPFGASTGRQFGGSTCPGDTSQHGSSAA